MFNIPPFPAWYAAHPLIVHLPLGVLALAPLFIIITMCSRRMRQPFSLMTLLVLLIGAGGVLLAAASGDATEHVVDIPVEAKQIIDQHEELGELSRNIFLGLTGAYLIVFVLVLAMGEKFKRIIWVLVHLVLLLATCAGLLVLANTGHLGARLVHEHGVHAHIGGLGNTGGEANP
jgi:uncharacterized membrane protein